MDKVCGNEVGGGRDLEKKKKVVNGKGEGNCSKNNRWEGTGF